MINTGGFAMNAIDNAVNHYRTLLEAQLERT